MLTDMFGGSFMPYMQHLCSADRKIFFDPVHLLKRARNSWLGQNDTNNTFWFPDAHTDSIRKALFSHLRKLCESVL
jgi:hypothetical protein